MPEALKGAWSVLLDAGMIAVGVLLLVCLLRAIIGPTTADRVIAVNMIGTQVVILICFLAVRLGEGYLTDVAMIYTLLSFLAVVALTRMFIGAHRERKEKENAEFRMQNSEFVKTADGAPAESGDEAEQE